VSSSTMTGTVVPARKPSCVTTTSTMRVEPARALRGSSTRPSSMSGAIDSSPTPMVNTGTPPACRGTIASVSGRSPVSAPSVTMTRPESGTPDSSSRAASSAFARLECVPSNVISPRPSMRRATSEKRKKRSTNRSESPRSSSLCSGVNASAMNWLRGTPASSVSSMLRESSSSTPTKFCCGTTVESVSVGCMRQKTSVATSATRRAAMILRSTIVLLPRAMV
jgi:hypothetical protein